MNKVSKHVAECGKKIDYINFNHYHSFDNVLHKSTIAAPARAVNCTPKTGLKVTVMV